MGGLAECCLAAYGGHVWTTSKAIRNLSLQKEAFRAHSPAPLGVYSGIMTCIKADKDHPGTIELLKGMAVRGWAPLAEANDPLAHLISLHNVGGVVNMGSLVVGLPNTAWEQGYVYAIIPASQMVRLMIAHSLSQLGIL